MVLLRPFFGSVRTGNPQKVSLPPGSAHRTRGAGYGCPKDVWTRAWPRGASERSFRGVVSFDERSGIGASKCPPREDGRGACPTLFGSKWLKSSEETVWKIAEGRRSCPFDGKKLPRGAPSTPLYRLRNLYFGTLPDFPNSFRKGYSPKLVHRSVL